MHKATAVRHAVHKAKKCSPYDKKNVVYKVTPRKPKSHKIMERKFR